MPGDALKIDFTIDALDHGDPFEHEEAVPEAIRNTIRRAQWLLMSCSYALPLYRWCAERTPEQIIHERESMISWIEAKAMKYRYVGACVLVEAFLPSA